MSDSLELAVHALRKGHRDEAVRLALLAWGRAPSARAAALLALLELDAGDPEAALDWTAKAVEREPASAALHLQLGRLCARLERHPDACAALAIATELAPASGPAWLELGHAHARCGDFEAALRAWRTAARSADVRDDALQAMTDALPLEAPMVAEPTTARPHERTPISLVMCSVENARFASAAASYRAALESWPHEIIRIADARSLAEGYTRGLARARHPWVIFSHDDVEVLARDFGARLAAHLAACDIVGIAGAERVAGPAWCHAGHPWLHGLVIYPQGDARGLAVHVYSPRGPLVPGLRVLDGVFLAMRCDTARRVGWDAQTFTGFHGYDVDFTLRAADMGLTLGAATDLGLLHRSTGRFDSAWRDAAARLARKHPALAGAPSPATHAFMRVVKDRVAAAAFAARWRFTAFVASWDSLLAEIATQLNLV